MTIASAVQFSQTCLNQISDSPHLDAERILLKVLDQAESAWLYAHHDQQLPVEAEQRFRELTIERATGKPLAYILGEWDFWGRSFFVTPDVLVPRPETEGLVETALAYVDSHLSGVSNLFVIADIGTGSGCIAVTLALELRIWNLEFRIVATDISSAALAVARKNAERHGVADKIEFLLEDMSETLRRARRHSINLIVCNPPYVPTAELSRAGRTPDTKGLTFEPNVALDGGPDGQYFVNQLKNAGVPALVEGINGDVLYSNITRTFPLSLR